MSVGAQIDSLVDALDDLSQLHQFAFGLCILERAVPLFFEFTAESGHRGSGEVLAALASCWRYLEAEVDSMPGFVSVNECENVAPDSEDYGTVHTPAAMDAVDIACNLLEFIREPEKRLIEATINAQIDTIDLFAQRLGFSGGISEDHPFMSGESSLMSEEIARMRDDLLFLADEASDRPLLAAQLARRILDLNYRDLRIVRAPAGVVLS
jgi:hypothetical protein